MQVWNALHAARCKYRTQKIAKNSHRGTIAQLCRAISSQLRHNRKRNLLNSNVSPTRTSQYGELRPTSGWDLLASLRHPCKFQRVSRLGSVNARHSSSGRQAKLRRSTEDAIYIRQGGHHVGHWPAFLVLCLMWSRLTQSDVWIFIELGKMVNFGPQKSQSNFGSNPEHACGYFIIVIG